jgi:hypothetical protein
MIVILISLIVGAVGLIMYALSPPTKPNTKEIGRIMFFVGLFWLVYILSSTQLNLFGAAAVYHR